MARNWKMALSLFAIAFNLVLLVENPAIPRVTLIAAEKQANVDDTLDLTIRTRVETKKNSGRHHVLNDEIQWDAKKPQLSSAPCGTSIGVRGLAGGWLRWLGE